jgi:Leucine-rich repeat (LRR) protein
MKKNIALVLFACTFFLYTHSYSDDAQVVESILELNNNLNWRIDEIATFTNGRIVSLNLNNQDIGNEGITTLGPEIGQLSELTKLTINDNDLTALPAAVFSLTNLRTLEIRNNSLMSLPNGISYLTQLRELDLRNNQLSELPAEIGNLKSLVKLHLWGNNLTAIPPEIGNLSTLKELYLKNNRLRNLPVEITKLRIKYIDVLDNHLCFLSDPVDKWLRRFDNKYEVLQKCQGEKRFK